MKLIRTRPDPPLLADFYGNALTMLGALCERTWHDRLCVVAEGKSARLWNDDGALHDVELRFATAETNAPRDPAREVFPGCPLTFRLAEAMLGQPPVLERVAIRPQDVPRQAPAADTAARLWHSQFVGTAGWRLEQPFQPTWHVSLAALVRCEIQAIDQHWSAHRLVLNLATGAADRSLAEALEMAAVDPEAQPAWPAPDPGHWLPGLLRVLEAELTEELMGIRQRQERYLQRELQRIDDYYDAYERELLERRRRSDRDTVHLRVAERLAAATADRERRRQDQLHRHEIRIIPHWDALLLLAEPAWSAVVSAIEGHDRRVDQARFVPRLRWWLRCADVVRPGHSECRGGAVNPSSRSGNPLRM